MVSLTNIILFVVEFLLGIVVSYLLVEIPAIPQEKLTQYYYNLFKNYSSDFECEDVLVQRGYDNKWYQRFQSQFRDRKLAQKYEDQVPKILNYNNWTLTDYIPCFLVAGYSGWACIKAMFSHVNWVSFIIGSLCFYGFLLEMVILYRTGHFSRSNPELVSVVKMIRSGKLKKFIMKVTTRHHLRANLWLLQNIYLFYALLNPQTYTYTRKYFQSQQGVTKIKQFFTFIQNPALQKCLTTDQATFDSLQAQIAQELDQLVSSSLTLLQQGLPVDILVIDWQTEQEQQEQEEQEEQAEEEQQQILHQGQQVLQQYQQATHPQAPDTTIDQASQTLKQAQEIWSPARTKD